MSAELDIKYTKLHIIDGEKRGEDMSFLRELLKFWSSYEGYEGAKRALKECGIPPEKR